MLISTERLDLFPNPPSQNQCTHAHDRNGPNRTHKAGQKIMIFQCGYCGLYFAIYPQYQQEERRYNQVAKNQNGSNYQPVGRDRLESLIELVTECKPFRRRHQFCIITWNAVEYTNVETRY